MPSDSPDTAKWLAYADRDLERARKMMEWGDLSDAGFHIQQAVEKYLKGFLLKNGWKLRKIHNLDVLLNEAVKYDPSLEELRIQLARITEYFVEERYPGLEDSDLTLAEIRESLTWAEQIGERVKRRDS